MATDSLAVDAFQVVGAVMCAFGVLAILTYIIDADSPVAAVCGWIVVGCVTLMVFFAVLSMGGV